MRKPFKDVKSKPAIVPKGSAQHKAKQPKANLQTQEPSASQDSSAVQPVEVQAQAAASEGLSGKATSASGSPETKGAQPKPKASRSKKR